MIFMAVAERISAVATRCGWQQYTTSRGEHWSCSVSGGGQSARQIQHDRSRDTSTAHVRQLQRHAPGRLPAL